MTTDPDKNADLTNLLMRLLDDVLVPEESARLAEILREDASARAVYHDYIEAHALLHWEHGQLEELPPIDLAALTPLVTEDDPLFGLASTPTESDSAGGSVGGAAPVARATESPVLGFLGGCLRQGGAFLNNSNVFTLLVAVGVPTLMLAALVISMIWRAEPEGPVAHVTCLHDGKGHWIDQDRAFALYSGMRLFEGQKLVLEEGFAEVVFASGARVVLEAPTTFETRGPRTGFLRVGRLSVGVPPEARDFTIATPLASVVDLGTEFGVIVADDGTAEAHVFKGEVVLTTNPTGRSPASELEHLVVGQAARISADASRHQPRVERIPATEKAFVRQMPTPTTKATVRFMHQGSRDPEAEGWTLFMDAPKANVDADKPVLQSADEDGTAAWMMANGASDRLIQYQIASNQVLGREIVARARLKGWILSARVKVDPVAKPGDSICHIRYHDESKKWILCPGIHADGNQYVYLSGRSSLGENAVFDVPNSRDRYVDYEVRFNPATSDADVFVNGQRIATGFVSEGEKEPPGLFFGLQDRVSKARFARVEWVVAE